MPNTLTQSTLRITEGYCELGMWQHAWDELQRLKSPAHVILPALALRMKVLNGLASHEASLRLGRRLIEQFPHFPALRREVGAAFLDAAKALVAQGERLKARDVLAECVKIDPQRRLETLENGQFEGIW